MNQDSEFQDGKLVCREIAKRMGIKHEKIMQTLRNYREQLKKDRVTEESNGASSDQTTRQEEQ